MADVDDLDKMIAKLQWRLESVESRLQEGTKTFEVVRESIVATRDELRSEMELLRLPWWKVLVPTVAAFVLVAGWIWQVAQYPDRAEYSATASQIHRMQLAQVEIKTDVSQLKEATDETRESNRAITDALQRIIEKQTTLVESISRLDDDRLNR